LEDQLEKVHLSRRRLIGTATAAGIGAAIDQITPSSALADVIDQTAATPVPLGDPVPPEFAIATNWPYEGGDLRGTRAAAESSINTSTIGQLAEAWSFPVTASGAYGSLTSNPVVAGDLLFVQDAAANVYALNKETGEQIWNKTLNSKVPTGGPNGVAIAYGIAYYTDGGTGDVFAVKAETGEQVWHRNILGSRGEGITTAPLVFDSVVYVSTIPGDPSTFYRGGYRGIISALDASNGSTLWYFDTTTDNLWGNARLNSGGGFWHPPSVDENNQLYVGIGNAGPWPGGADTPNGSSRPGDNDYANCILKLDPDTGSLVWYYNANPHDLFDWDNQLTPILVDLPIDGVDRKLVFTSGKHGYLICLDRESGEVLWRVPVGTHMHDDTKEIPEGESVEVWPGVAGGVETPMAYADGKIFCPVLEAGTFFTSTGVDAVNTPSLVFGAGVLVAVNAADGSIAWETKIPTVVLGGATVTNDVVYTSGFDGLIRGFNTADGTEVFRHQATAGINASPAVSGDYLYWAAGSFLIPGADNPTLNPAPVAQIIALKLGGDA
jgi:outer membrane protein assembly factor BamB